MSMLVEQQDETINTIENQAGGVSTDMEAGYVSLSSSLRP
jgi:t-SNARE complex subunit (syntaxin)